MLQPEKYLGSWFEWFHVGVVVNKKASLIKAAFSLFSVTTGCLLI
jgi:hypothetical protein